MKFLDYHTEAMSFTVYPRVEDTATRERVENVLDNREMNAHPHIVDELIRAVLKDLPIYPALGLAGECGETLEKIKKAWRDNGVIDKPKTLKELGDVLWYVTAIARDLGFTLEDVAQASLDKLRGRRANGTIHGSGDDR